MYDLLTTGSDSLIDKNKILSKVSEYKIFTFYIGKQFTINSIFNSPLRKDKTPSFGVFRARNGSLLFKDLATGVNGDCFKFVQLKLHKKDYISAMLQVYLDLVANEKTFQSISDIKEVEKDKVELGTLIGKFNEADLEYWKGFNISEDTLNYFNVYKSDLLFINGHVIKRSSLRNPIYVYKIYQNLKFYIPLETQGTKHISGLCQYDFGGYEQLPKTGDLVIITKSMKDVMFLYSLGYTAICSPSESAKIPQVVISDLKGRFKDIVIFYDNDTWGLQDARKTAEEFDLKYVFIPTEFKEKDPTDFYKQYGLQQTEILLQKLLKTQ